MTYNRVSIIILTFNNLRYTKQCVESLYEYTKIDDFELILVDNASTDDTQTWIKEIAKKHSNIEYVINLQNNNFSGGCNQGAKLAKGEYLLFLNNDTILTPNWLQPMLDCFTDKTIGIVGNKHLFPNSDIVWHCGGVVGNDGLPKHIYVGYTTKSPMVNVSRDYFYVTGACLLIKKDIFDEVGGFETEYINSCEDTDLCLKVRKLDYKIYYCSESFIYHYGSISSQRLQFEKDNIEILLRRWSHELIPGEEECFALDNFPECLSSENKADLLIYSKQKELAEANQNVNRLADILHSPKKLLWNIITHLIRKIMKRQHPLKKVNEL